VQSFEPDLVLLMPDGAVDVWSGLPGPGGPGL